MKLRNKKTREIATKIDVGQDNESFWVLGNKPRMYSSLAELNEEWEDYTPAEPLIKDEKIRKAVRAWADANDYPELLYDKDKDCLYSPYGSDNTDTSVSISFTECCVLEKLEHRELYTIAELCGEEEE